MIAYVLKYDILPGKTDDYARWAPGALERLSSRPGVAEARIFGTIAGPTNTVLIFGFADMAAFAAWHEDREVQGVFYEARSLVGALQTELWGPSPVGGPKA